MEGFISALLVAIITTIVQWRIARKDREAREKERKDKFRLAALEKRLDIHQEAYYQWNKMLDLRFEENTERRNYLFECQEWYYKNCLFLDSKSRLEFKKCLNNIFDYKMYWQMWKESTKKTKEYDTANMTLKNTWAQILKTGEIIAKGIDLDHERIDDFEKELSMDQKK